MTPAKCFWNGAWARSVAFAAVLLAVGGAPSSTSAQDLSLFGAGKANEKALIYSLLSEASYKAAATGQPRTNVGEWTLIDSVDKSGSTGFEAGVYRNASTGKIVISFAGTDPTSSGDLKADAQQTLGILPDQYKQAKEMTAAAIKKYGAGNIEVTGHSLGGGLAQFVSLSFGLAGMGFNSAGLSGNTIAAAGGSTADTSKAKFDNYYNTGDKIHIPGTLIGKEHELTPIKDGTPYAGWGNYDQTELGKRVGADDPDNRDGSGVGGDLHTIKTPIKILAEESRGLVSLAATFAEDGRTRLVLEQQAEISARNAVRKVDVLFLADNTGSMGGVIGTVQSYAQNIIDRLNAHDSSVLINYGVGRYYGDPTEWGETPTSSYQLQRTITSNTASVKAAINAWSASGGGDWEEANFYALQQAATNGAGTPRDGSKATLQATGWRTGAAKVIIIFGDAPSWQNSVTEKELRAVLKDKNVRVCFIDSSGLNGAGSAPIAWDSTTGTQLAGAGQEIAEGTNGAYVNVSGLSSAKIADAVVNAVTDAMSDNPWGGGHLARIDATKTWRNRAPSSVEGSSLGNNVSLTLRNPGQDNSLFTFSTGSGTLVPGKVWYTKEIGTNPTLFWETFDTRSIVDFSETLDFYRFDLRKNGTPTNTKLAGYYGKNWTGTLGSSKFYLYDLTSWAVNPGWTGGASRSGADSMRLAANWGNGRVYGADSTPPGFDGFGFYLGQMDSSGKVSGGVYVAKSQVYETNPSYASYVQDSGRGNTVLNFYGNSAPIGVGGTFSTLWYDQTRAPSTSSVILAGFASEKQSEPNWANGMTYKGFTAGLVQNRSTGASQILASNNLDDVNIRFVDYGIVASVSATSGAETHSVSIGTSDSSALASPQMFGGVKTVNNAPAYVATSMSGQEGYSYMSWGYWSVDSDVAGTIKTVAPKTPWIAGRVTTGSEVGALSGTAHYFGDVRGLLNESSSPTAVTTVSGTTALTATFGSSPISLTGTFNDLKRANGTTWVQTANLSAASAGGGSLSGTISGTTFVGGTPVSGAVNGAFFGPRAQEVGGNWSLSNAGATTKAAGTFNAKQ